MARALAKHIQIARESGAAAGMLAYLAAPSSKMSPNYAQITKRRKPETQLEAYCSIFGEQIGDNTPITPASEDADLTTLSKAELIARLMQQEAVPVEDVEPSYSVEVMAFAEKFGLDPATVNALFEAAAENEAEVEDTDEVELVTNTAFITGDVAWDKLGRGIARQNAETRAEPATNGQLYRLNVQGLLSV